MVQVFGDFIENFAGEEHDNDSLELSFSPSSRPIKQRWRNNRLSAHFVADYLSTFFPISDDDPSSVRRKKQSKGAVSYVANELLENAMKFNPDSSDYRIRFGIHFLEEPDIQVVLFVTNAITSDGITKFKTFIEELTQSDPDELYIRQIEKSAEEDTEASGLGLITMVNDYSAKLGWKFGHAASNSEILTVTTMAQIPV